MAIDTVIVGLGNPGPQYQRTRHNAGFLLVGALAAAHAVALRQERHGALVGDGRVGSHRCLFALPQTYMNRSGDSVRRILSFTGLDHGSLVVVHDDLDLPLGRLRLRRGGGAGGHRGIASILEHLGNSRLHSSQDRHRPSARGSARRGVRPPGVRGPRAGPPS